MEALLFASGVLLATQYKRNPHLRVPFSLFTGSTAADDEDADNGGPGDEDADNGGPDDEDADNGGPDDEDADDDDEVGQKQAFAPDPYYYNRVDRKEALVVPPNPTRPPLGVVNPVEEDMMRDIRNGAVRLPAAGAAAYRPSWVRNVLDAGAPTRQEQVKEWSTETLRDAQNHTLPNVSALYGQKSIQTLNQFGKGGLPFEEQIRVRPDGLDPVPERRQPTARYNAYALGEDLTREMQDQGRVRGQAVGQGARGGAVRQEAWDFMPDRDIQFQPANAPKLLGSGVRSGGRGAPLSSFVGAIVEPLPSMARSSAVEWDAGPTGNRGLTERGPVRPQDDPMDKRFVYEDIDPTQAQRGVAGHSTITSNKGFRGVDYDPAPLTAAVETFPKAKQLNPRLDVLKGSTSQAAEAASWRFSFDIKRLFDVSLPVAAKNRDDKLSTNDDMRTSGVVELNANKQVQRIVLPAPDNARKETAPDKRILFPDKDRKHVKTDTADSKRRDMNFQPKTHKAGVFGGVSVFKTSTSANQKAVSSSAIAVAKKQATETAAPQGANLSGRSVPIKKSDALTKRLAENSALSYDNDKLVDLAGKLSAPQRAPKGTTPDYAQDQIGTMRTAGEFRRR